MSNWDGYPPDPERDGRHLLFLNNKQLYIAEWAIEEQFPWRVLEFGHHCQFAPGPLADFGFSYVYRISTPDEIKARERAAELRGFAAALAIAEKYDGADVDYLRVEFARRIVTQCRAETQDG